LITGKGEERTEPRREREKENSGWSPKNGGEGKDSITRGRPWVGVIKAGRRRRKKKNPLDERIAAEVRRTNHVQKNKKTRRPQVHTRRELKKRCREEGRTPHIVFNSQEDVKAVAT